jgi:Spy/CpxP family protein refolding chaperone
MQADMRNQLSGVLTPEQMQKLDTMREERDERREEKMEKWKEKREKHKERY